MAQPTVFRSPETAPEGAVLAIWSETLGSAGFDVDCNCFELGGESTAVHEVNTRFDDASYAEFVSNHGIVVAHFKAGAGTPAASP